MRKIPTLFVRDPETHRLTPEVTPGCEWVAQGLGLGTRKLDGSACLVLHADLFKRYDAKQGKPPPAGFIPAQEAADPTTGHFPGWLPVTCSPEDRYHREAWEGAGQDLLEWTYELVGPKVNGGHEKMFVKHVLVRHGAIVLLDCPRDLDGIRAYLEAESYLEGIVWWKDIADPNCEKVKIKAKDFLLPFPREPKP